MSTREWNKIYKGYANDTKESLAKQARQYFYEIYNETTKLVDNDKYAQDFVMSLFASFIAADNKIAPDEWALYNFILEISEANNYENIQSCVDNFKKNYNYDELDEIIDLCPQELKNKIIKFGLCVCAIDEKITISEQQIIEKFAE